ncbi:MAG: TRAM domain-containing protein [Candidatus Micrarchaeota archaeon]
MSGFNQPIDIGDECNVTIEAQGNRGDGIAHIEGFVVFVKNGKVGDKLKVRIQTVRRTFAIAEIIK